MHCPRCGQQQVSEETKFCSRCGFQLGLVAELLANGGFLPQLAELYKGRSTLFTRKNGLIFTALWFILFVMMIPAFGGLADAEEVSAVSAVFGLFSTMMLFILSLAFLKRAPKAYELKQLDPMNQAAALYGNANRNALPPQHSVPATEYTAPQGGWRAPDTDDLVRPASVTEQTTKLLKKDRDTQ